MGKIRHLYLSSYRQGMLAGVVERKGDANVLEKKNAEIILFTKSSQEFLLYQPTKC